MDAQRQVDSEIQAELADVTQTVTLLGDLLVSLRRQMSIKCDWNTSSFYITRSLYETEFPCVEVRKHLVKHKNVTAKILDLQTKIHGTFKDHLPDLRTSEIRQGISDGLAPLNPPLALRGGWMDP